ncbi:hypothetical protein BS78_03G220300 [Paspalum vaginatum]|nr:hypothetical protein BS78_03G220300 [Paspalum vaginatum]
MHLLSPRFRFSLCSMPARSQVGAVVDGRHTVQPTGGPGRSRFNSFGRLSFIRYLPGSSCRHPFLQHRIILPQAPTGTYYLRLVHCFFIFLPREKWPSPFSASVGGPAESVFYFAHGAGPC